MDIKKIIREVLLEQEDGEAAPNPQPQLTRAQREALASLTEKWRQEVPSLTDDQAMEIFLKYRKILPALVNPKQPAINAFIVRSNGKYGFNDLRDISNVTLKDFLTFLLEYDKFRILLGPNVTDSEQEELKLDRIFNEKPANRGVGGITPEKIETSKKMWYGTENLVIQENGFRVYWVPNNKFSVRMGYFYQEKLRELLQHNVDNQVGKIYDIYRNDNFGSTRYNANPWCLVSRSSDQMVYYKNEELVKAVSNAYSMYRHEYSYYYVIDESKDLFGQGGEYYIGAILAGKNGDFQVAPMYNGQYNISTENLLKIYPQLTGHLDKMIYHKYNEKNELNDSQPISILDRINEQEGSPYAFWMQGPDEKAQYINDGRILRKGKSWDTLVDDLRNEYINRITGTNALSRIDNDEFMRAIIRSGNKWKNTLNHHLVTKGLPGISYLAENFMVREFVLDFTGMKNSNIKIYKSKVTGKYGIYDLNNLGWMEKDGKTYEADFTKRVLPLPEGELEDFTNNKIYDVVEFASPSAKFFTLNDIDGKNDVVYILSERKYHELRDKLDNDGGVDDENDIDIAEDYI